MVTASSKTLAAIERALTKVKTHAAVVERAPKPRRAPISAKTLAEVSAAIGGRIPCLGQQWPTRDNVPCGFGVGATGEMVRLVCPCQCHVSPPKNPRKVQTP